MKDKRGRNIKLEVDDLDVVARHCGREVGRFRFDEIDCGPKVASYIKLMYMQVDQEYQKAGIGVSMMRLAVKTHETFSRPPLSAIGGPHVPAEEYYRREGAALINRCIDLKVLSPDWVDVDDFGDGEVAYAD